MARRNKGIMDRRDIPFAQRLQMQRKAQIIHNREQAAKAVMFCQSVALHRLEGIGFKRLVRFALHFKKVNDEFYEDPVVGMAHAKARMEQLGMPISGELFTVTGKNKLETEMENHALQAAQIALICGAITMNDEFGFGKERQERVSALTKELTARYAREGIDFLLEELEQIGFVIVAGEARAWLDDEGNALTLKQAQAYFGPESRQMLEA